MWHKINLEAQNRDLPPIGEMVIMIARADCKSQNATMALTDSNNLIWEYWNGKKEYVETGDIWTNFPVEEL